jgi:hypothetical protein
MSRGRCRRHTSVYYAALLHSSKLSCAMLPTDLILKARVIKREEKTAAASLRAGDFC